MQRSIALIELTSIARGYRVADELVKKAPVRLLDLGVVSPGKYLVVLEGDVALVEEAFLRGLEVGADQVLDRLFLPQPHAEVLAALEQQLQPSEVDALGVVETFSASSTLKSADVALKAAQVSLQELHYQKHLGGKGFFVLSGEQHDVEAALEAATHCLRENGMLLRTELLARPHTDFTKRLYGARS